MSIFFILVSCKKLEDLNQNTKDPVAVPGESLFSNAQKNLFDQMVSSNVNYNIFRLIDQYWTETTYVDESNYDLVTRTIPDRHWDHLYRDVLKNLFEANKFIKGTKPLTASDSTIKGNKLAIIDILTVYTYSVLVETFGNVPYTETFDATKPLAAYDDAFTIYKDLITRLTNDVNSLDNTEGSFDVADNMYQGNVDNWIKFANSLKLRMGINISDIPTTDPLDLAKTTIESAAANVISSNAENARITYMESPPNTNPIWVDLVSSKRHDFVPCATLVDTMNALKDPRRAFYFTQIDTSSDGSGKFAYVGGINGIANKYSGFSHIADLIQTPTFPGTIFDYAEVEFLLAEAVERGYAVGGTAEEHYNNAIQASILDWGGSSADVTTYLANPDVAYSTAKGNFQRKIGIQTWIALYNRGFEGWTAWRRLDVPVLVAPPAAKSEFPVRFTYPIEEQTLNGANYKAASTAIGGDDVSTKLFWDKH